MGTTKIKLKKKKVICFKGTGEPSYIGTACSNNFFWVEILTVLLAFGFLLQVQHH